MRHWTKYSHSPVNWQKETRPYPGQNEFAAAIEVFRLRKFRDKVCMTRMTQGE